jgi:hypothetical protein
MNLLEMILSKKQNIMDFDELFDNGDKHHKHKHSSYSNHHDDYKSRKSYHDDDYRARESHHDDYRSRSSHSHHSNMQRELLAKLQSNPKLKMLLIIALIVILIIVVLLAVLLYPLIIKLFEYLSQNGIQGIIDTIWQGSKK